ncbi:hypothetical protein HY837_04845 [archaeon]|nr:hypothetical protein [archaeon]
MNTRTEALSRILKESYHEALEEYNDAPVRELFNYKAQLFQGKTPEFYDDVFLYSIIVRFPENLIANLDGDLIYEKLIVADEGHRKSFFEFHFPAVNIKDLEKEVNETLKNMPLRVLEKQTHAMTNVGLLYLERMKERVKAKVTSSLDVLSTHLSLLSAYVD